MTAARQGATRASAAARSAVFRRPRPLRARKQHSSKMLTSSPCSSCSRRQAAATSRCPYNASEWAQNSSASAMPPDATGIAASGIAEADVEAPRRAHQRALRIDALRRGDGVGERYIDDLAVAPGDHAVHVSGSDQVDRMHAKHRAAQAVDRTGLAAALDMAEHGDAGLGAGQAGKRLAEAVA